MTKTELLEKLKAEVSQKEYDELMNHKMEHISSFNEKTILEMMESGMISENEIDASKVEQLQKITYEYLEQYLPQYPASWKWVYMSCAYQTFIKCEPMHPREWVHYTTESVDGERRYYCPAKSKEKGTNCELCVCRFVNEKS